MIRTWWGSPQEWGHALIKVTPESLPMYPSPPCEDTVKWETWTQKWSLNRHRICSHPDAGIPSLQNYEKCISVVCRPPSLWSAITVHTNLWCNSLDVTFRKIIPGWGLREVLSSPLPYSGWWLHGHIHCEICHWGLCLWFVKFSIFFFINNLQSLYQKN